MKKMGDAQTSSTPPPQYPIESVDNALKVLLLLGERNELRLTDVAEYLGVATSTAHRLLAMLQYRGFMRQEPRSKAYLPGAALTGVAYAILQKFDVRGALHPFVESLNGDLAETVHLAILEGTSVRFIDAIESPHATRVASRLGRLMPANCTSTGKALLSELPVADIERLYPTEDLPVLTPNSIRTRSALEEELEAVSRDGYATSREESEDGVCSVAVPIPGHASMRLAFNVAVPIHRMNAEFTQRIAAALQAAAAEAAGLLH